MIDTIDAAFAFAGNADWRRAADFAQKAVQDDPHDANAHALLALARSHIDLKPEAVEAGRRAVTLAPDLHFAHYAHGWALLQNEQIALAQKAALEAVRLNPDAHEFALLADVYFRQGRWRLALDTADLGLDVDPENESCGNFRALALICLGHTEAAWTAVEQSLALDPDNGCAHASRGWLLLRECRVEEALESYRAALRLEPDMEWALVGNAYALKVRNRGYRYFWKLSVWASSLRGRSRVIAIVCLYLVIQAGSTLAEDYPEAATFVDPLLKLPVFFLLGQWFGPHFSILCRGRMPIAPLVLPYVERMASNLVGSCLAITAIGGFAFLVTLSTIWLVLAAICMLLLLPIGDAAKTYGTRAQRPFAIGASVLAGFGACVVLTFPQQPSVSGALLAGLFACVFAWSLAANRLFVRYE